jgi:uncharacterized protein (UPF0333 family)
MLCSKVQLKIVNVSLLSLLFFVVVIVVIISFMQGIYTYIPGTTTTTTTAAAAAANEFRISYQPLSGYSVKTFLKCTF